MCGIAGIVDPSAGTPDAPDLGHADIAAMTTAITHRGPDAEGFFERPGIAFGHRRLKIIDLTGGAQPMSDPDGRVWVTYNGEIYNHESLRRELEPWGIHVSIVEPGAIATPIWNKSIDRARYRSPDRAP